MVNVEWAIRKLRDKLFAEFAIRLKFFGKLKFQNRKFSKVLEMKIEFWISKTRNFPNFANLAKTFSKMDRGNAIEDHLLNFRIFECPDFKRVNWAIVMKHQVMISIWMFFIEHWGDP